MNQRSAILRVFRRRLTNLSSRNRSLLLTGLPASQFLDLHEADFLLNRPSFSLIADIIGRKAAVAVCDVLDARQERSNEVSQKLRRIARTAAFITEERGTEDLYVGWPFVRGKFLDDTVVHAPLLFFPVQIEQQGKVWKLVRRGDELAFLNPAFALAYGHFNQISIPNDSLEKRFDDFDRDSLVFRTQLYEWLKTSPFEINFNQDSFTDTLQFFNKLTSKSLSQLEHTGELKIYQEAILGIFPQAGSFLVPDYDELIAQSEEPGGKTEELDKPDSEPQMEPSFSFLSPVALRRTPQFSFHERHLYTPLPLDASQEAALRTVKAGQSLVVQGPPGTGKSQLIANLMADAAANGKRVLLVCQKRAALDVVQERLQQVGMAPFLALIHDFQDDRRALYAQIAHQIEQIDAYKQQNNSLNTVLLERDFEQESRKIDETVRELDDFKKALFDTSSCGVSVKELYLSSNPELPSIGLDETYPHFPVDSVDKFEQQLSAYAAYRQRLGNNHPWNDRKSFSNRSALDMSKIGQTLHQWVETAQESTLQTTTLADRSLSLDELADWHLHDWDLTAILALLDEAVDNDLWATSQFLRLNLNHPALAIHETQLESLAQNWETALAAPGPELSLVVQETTQAELLLTEILPLRSSWARWKWWLLTDPRKAKLLQLVSANHLTLSEQDLQLLLRKVQKRIQLDAIGKQVAPLLANLPLTQRPDGLRLLRRAVHLTERLVDLKPLAQLPLSAWLTAQSFRNSVQTLLQIAKTVNERRLQAQLYLTDQQLQHIWNDHSFATQLQQSLRYDFDLLVEADRQYEGFSAIEHTVIGQLSSITPANWISTFHNSLCLAWITHIEQINPVLRSVSSLRMAQLEASLQESVQRKQLLSQDILLVKLREQTYRNLTFNRLNNVITYRDLLHQTTKKRAIWPVRKLMESFADEVFKLVPCWLASPESVSAMFPLRNELFDLVIFDEASQCFAENGIPAMFRGQQIVVTGDNQQLRPNDLYRVQLDDPDSENELATTTLEVESLLELAAQNLPQVSLTEHYRSRSLDLITFSNQHFYKNKLQLLPYFDDANRRQPAIHYRNVKGTWQHNTNLIEAEAIVELIDHLATELPDRSVGVVTFNYPQQQLIQDLLEKHADTQMSTDRTKQHLFVKNIENVQGDERDVIIFSIGYAPDERGRLSMQFGSLNSSGGANRLNVAVTRAKERVYVITSLWPDQLTVSNAINDGPRLLQAYLAYALDVAQGSFRPHYQANTILTTNSLLKNRLAQQYSNWQPELPFADLTVKTDDSYQSLVLTDDDIYYQQSIKQAHAYLPVALHVRKWPFKRLWSRQFWQKTDS
ncbi:AAA domain-containing protein [Spirosoma sp. SC4-14]|uniref:AAA domain-containing protein n=1 Tax=Spirosoma sp. SC4-14 TaxID=3128900 RepID=UPI0030CE236E